MKTLLSCTIVTLFLFVTTMSAQQQYTVDGKQYTLLTEIEGPLTLLWNTIEGEFRYFSKKGNTISELKNTKIDGRYQEEYKETLRLQTEDAPTDVARVKFTRPGLASFFVTYNKAKDPAYKHETASVQLKTRLGAFAGVSNGIFNRDTDNTPSNSLTPVAGIDFEILDEIMLKRHSVVIRFKQTFENSDTKSSSSQFSMNYRFKFVKTEKLAVFINTKFAAYTYSTGGNFNAPGAFGLGVDYAVGNGHITFCYNDIVAVGVDSNGEFPVDLTLGYKFNL